MHLPALSLLLLLLPLTLASSLPLSPRQFGIPLPDNDPFYLPPSGYASLAPGTILRNRTVQITGPDFWGIKYEAFQLLYKTRSHNGTALAGTTTVIRPTAAGNTNDKVVTFLTVYDSVPAKCKPSFIYRAGAPGLNVILTVEQFQTLPVLLRQNWIVTVPDYEGPDGATATGRLHGYVSIDAARATLAFKGIQWSSTAKAAFQGYSGGAIAGSWVAGLSASYAPDLPLAGISIGGVPANPRLDLTSMDGTSSAGLTFAAIGGFARSYKNFADNLNRVLTAEGKRSFGTVWTGCPQDLILGLNGKKFNSTATQTVGAAIWDQPWVSDVLTENTIALVPSEVPTAPVFVYHAVTDASVQIAEPDAMVSRWCANGAKSVTYLRNTGQTTHNDMSNLGLPRAVAFLTDRFAGKPAVTGCSIQNVTLS